MLVAVGGLEGYAFGLAFLLLYMGIAVAVEISQEVEDDILRCFQVEGDDDLALHMLTNVGRNLEREVVDDFADVGLSVLGEFLGYALGQHLGTRTLCVQAQGQHN